MCVEKICPCISLSLLLVQVFGFLSAADAGKKKKKKMERERKFITPPVHWPDHLDHFLCDICDDFSIISIFFILTHLMALPPTSPRQVSSHEVPRRF